MSKLYESRAPSSVSPAATEYYDPMNAVHDGEGEQPHISIHEPTPTYERHPSFPQPQVVSTIDAKSNGKSSIHRKTGSGGGSISKGSVVGYGYGTGTGTTNGARTPQQGVSPTSSKRVSINDDVILAPNSQADVKRGGTWAHGPGTSGPREDGGLKRGQSLAERATMASKHMPEKDRLALSKAESTSMSANIRLLVIDR